MFVDSYINLQWDRLRLILNCIFFFFFSSRRRHTRYWRDWSSDVCSSDLNTQSYRVFVIQGDTAKLRVVQLGTEEGDFVQILSGVEADETVATANLQQL